MEFKETAWYLYERYSVQVTVTMITDVLIYESTQCLFFTSNYIYQHAKV